MAAYVSGKYPNMNLVYGDDFDATYENLRNGKCLMMAARAADWDMFQRNAALNPDCSLKWIGRAEMVNSAGPASKIDVGEYCSSFVNHVIDIHMYEMIADGFVEEAWNNHVEALATNKCLDSDTSSTDEAGNSRSLRPIDVGGIFLIHVCVCLLAIIHAWFEKRRKQRKPFEAEASNKLEETLDSTAHVQACFGSSDYAVGNKEALRRALDSVEAAVPIPYDNNVSSYTTTAVYEVRLVSTFTQQTNAPADPNPVVSCTTAIQSSQK